VVRVVGLKNKILPFCDIYKYALSSPYKEKCSQIVNKLHEAESFLRSHYSPSQEISHLLWNLKVHYHVHKNLLLTHILSQMNPVHMLPPYFHKFHSDIIPSTPRSSKWSHRFTFYNQNTVCISPLYHACYMFHPSHPPSFDHPNNIW